jgi:hypothetical protein
MTDTLDSEVGRISVSLTGRAAAAVHQLGNRFELSDGAVVRRAISLLSEIVAEEDRGARLMIKEPDNPEPMLVKLVYGP